MSPGIIDEAVGNVLCDLTVMVAYYRLAFTVAVKAIRELISLFPLRKTTGACLLVK